MKLTCIIIDDEHLARQYLHDYIKKIPFLDLKGDFNSPLKALDLLSSRIDLVFLDIEMPDISGLDFLKTLENPPFVILTTAYKEYALEGFELNVSDYLLKPFSFDRFLKAVNKVSELISKANHLRSRHPNENFMSTPQTYDNYLVIRADRKYYKINYDDLVLIQGQKAYVTFYTTSKQITALASLKDLEQKLPKETFIRIHKSYIVAVKNIRSLEGNLIEIGKKALPVGKSYKNNVSKIFRLLG